MRLDPFEGICCPNKEHVKSTPGKKKETTILQMNKETKA